MIKIEDNEVVMNFITQEQLAKARNVSDEFFKDFPQTEDYELLREMVKDIYINAILKLPADYTVT